MDFEKKITRLEEIVSKMEKGDLALEESLKLFEEGVKLSRECQTQLQDAQARVQKLIGFDETGQPMMEEFKPETSDSGPRS
jgi:exodeoxyribonuclease VII small subunit